MLSVSNTATAAKKISSEFEQCSCSVLMILSKNVLFLYNQVADIRPRETGVVVTTLTGNSQQKARDKTAGTLRLCCVFRYSMEYSAALNV